MAQLLQSKPKTFFPQKPGDKLAEKMKKHHQERVAARRLGLPEPDFDPAPASPDLAEALAKQLGIPGPYERASPRVAMRSMAKSLNLQQNGKRKRSDRQRAFAGKE